MPYPFAHFMFFMYCFAAVGVYSSIQNLLKHQLSIKDSMHILILITVGGIASLLPDIPAVYNYIVNDNLQHVRIGEIHTHSFFFSYFAFMGAVFIGYIIYRNIDKAAYLGVFAESAFISHLILDDMAEGGLSYLYPIYNEPISVFSYMNVQFSGVDFLYYNLACLVSIIMLLSIMFMTLFALNQLGFEFDYRSD